QRARGLAREPGADAGREPSRGALARRGAGAAAGGGAAGGAAVGGRAGLVRDPAAARAAVAADALGAHAAHVRAVRPRRQAQGVRDRRRLRARRGRRAGVGAAPEPRRRGVVVIARRLSQRLLAALVVGACAFPFAVLAVLSLADGWTFPAPWPTAW